ncbi:MAG: peroxidase, partial [Bacilli bacterium]|nr:peroxidase [Bacilli bacterium]
MNDNIHSLKTKTPEEGFQLAVRLAQKTVGTIQPDRAIRQRLRPKYSRNAELLIAASQVVATYF